MGFLLCYQQLLSQPSRCCTASSSSDYIWFVAVGQPAAYEWGLVEVVG